MLISRHRRLELRDVLNERKSWIEREIEGKRLILTRLDEALRRVDKGNYGICSDCKGEIDVERLRTLPFAHRCKECEKKKNGHGLPHT